MKKFTIIAGAALVAMATLTACNNGGKKYDSADKAFGDSIATALGEFAGAQSNMSYTRMKEMQPDMAAKFKKESFLRGVSAVLNADSTDIAYYQGLQMGLQLVNPINGINNEAGYPVAKDLVLAAFKEVYMADTIADMNQYYASYQQLMTALNTRMRAKAERQKAIDDSIKASTPEAQANLKEGADYINKVVAEDGYTKAESGIAYKIDNAGAEPKANKTDMVKINYTGRHINGEVFDQGENYVNRASGFVTGFREALTLLGAGGKMTVVIPADLAYGLDGTEGIGPNETLVFDIELVEVNPQ